MSLKKEILKGTLILTSAGIVTRILGLYNKVFLANVISASELGLYQLIFPVLSVCSAICCYGIESALSKVISGQSAGQGVKNTGRTISIGVGLALALSLLLFSIVFILAEPIAVFLIREPACAPYLKIMAFVIPFSTMHSCISGYFLGMRRAGVPAASQLIEQIIRVGTIYGLSVTFYAAGGADASMAVYGMLAGEVISCLFTVTAYKISQVRRYKKYGHRVSTPDSYKTLASVLLSYAVPLTANRLALTLLQSFEAVLIPMMLKMYYGDSETALSIYAVATAMAFPFIMFPTTITNSLASMLMPAVSKASEENDYGMIRRTISKSIHYCLLIGILSMTVFFVYGRILGIVIFKNEMAGEFLTIFAFLCPFIYIASSLAGTLNGLGKVKLTMMNSMISLGVRIAFLVFVVPKTGINGYLWGQMAGYLILVGLDGRSVVKIAGLTLNPWRTIIFPAGFAAAGAMFSLAVYRCLLYMAVVPTLLLVVIACVVIAAIYGGSLLVTGIIDGHV